MKSAGAPLIAYLNSGQQFIVADLYTFTTASGAVYRYASADSNITVGGNTFDAQSIIIKRGQTNIVIGVQVDTLDLTIAALPTNTIGGGAWISAVRTGFFDAAQVKVERLFMPTFGDVSLGTIVLFTGRVAEVTAGRFTAKLAVKSDLELLNIQMPRNVFQPGCLNTLFDTCCTLLPATFGVSSTANSGCTTSTIYNSLVQAAGYFSQGYIKFTSGALSGISAGISSYVPGTIVMLGPLPSAPAAGDAFTVYPGCDKQQATCSSKFSNLSHFRGTPYVPVPESVI